MEKVGTRMTKWLLVRKPCLMEDEGRNTIVSTFHSQGQAQEWIDSQEGQFFHPSDYKIIPIYMGARI